MKLSTAIRIGSMTTKQITGMFWDGGNGRCALGAAMDALGFSEINCKGVDSVGSAYRKLIDMYPAINMTDIWTMNDQLGYTREQIADWVETVENELEAKEKNNEVNSGREESVRNQVERTVVQSV